MGKNSAKQNFAQWETNAFEKLAIIGSVLKYRIGLKISIYSFTLAEITGMIEIEYSSLRTFLATFRDFQL